MCTHAVCGDGFVQMNKEICDGVGPVPHTKCAQDCASASCINTEGDAWSDCNNNPLDGCEVSLSTPNDCGGCGVKCMDAQICVWVEVGSKYFCVN